MESKAIVSRRVRPRFSWKAPVWAAMLAVVLLSIPYGPGAARPVLAAGAPCTTTTTSNYSIQVCLSQPADGATVTGTTTVTGTFTMLAGTTRVQQMVFSLDDKYLLTDFQRSPDTFTISTQRWVDGPHKLSLYGSLNDNSDTSLNPAFIYLNFANGVSTPPVNTNARTPTSGTVPAPGSPFVVAVTGDGAGGDPYTTSVMGQIAPWSPNLLLYLGDVYQNGSYAEYQNWYDPTFGQYRSITDPIVGNHEYLTLRTSAPDYFDYWDNLKSYYSFDAGGWHFIALNSNATALGANMPLPNGWRDEKTWLTNDLAAHQGACIIAYWHHPAYNIGQENESGQALDFWNLLYPAHATLILNGHDHTYQRWQPMDPNRNVTASGITEIIAGTGGHAASSFKKSDPNVVKQLAGVYAFGALKLKLSSTSLDYQFVQAWGATAGTVYDSNTLACQGYGTLTGTVTDAVTGRPVAGATVGYGSTSTTTNASGLYTLTQAPLNSYSLSAGATNYTSQSQTVTVRPASTTTQNFALAPQPGTISGTVSDAVTGRPISGATVADGALTATTDANGNYTLANLMEGTHNLTATAPNYASRSATVAVGPGSSVSQSFNLNPLPGSITGRVTDASTALPVSGAVVSYTAGGTTYSATTDINGIYTLSGIVEGTFSLTAAATGYISRTAAVAVGPGAGVTQNWSLNPLPGSITGRITDAQTGLSVSGATVSYTSAGVTISAPSDVNGNYTLTGVPEGSYTVTASGSGFASQSTPVTVGPGSTVNQNFTLVPLNGTISGNVTDQGTTAPINGATVSYVSGGVTHSVTTDVNGNYALTDVPAPGTYSVTASASGYTSQAATVSVSRAGVATANFAMQLLPGSINGRATDALTGAAVGGATVSYVNDAATITATADSNGNYALSNVPPGSYVVSAAAAGYSSQSQTVTVVSNAATVANFTLSPLPGSIGGTVTDGSTGLGISGATVAFTVGSVTTSGTTDVNGNYAFSNVIEGSYSLTASAPGYVSQTAAVTVQAGASVTQNFALPLPPGTIIGRVTDGATANAIAGATVSYTVSGSTTTVTADANGNYTLSNVPPGTYSLTASATGYTSQTQVVAVTTNATSSQNFSLVVLPGAIAGAVKNSHNGTGVGGATVSYTNGGITTTVTADAAGNYSIANVPPGTYSVTAAATGYGSQSLPVTVTSNATTTQDFSLVPQEGNITGRVTDAGTGAAIAGATVSLVVGGTTISATADASGNYTLLNVRPGTYTVTAAAGNYGSRTLQVTVTPGGTTTQDFSLTPLPGSIRGQVTDSVTTQPINGATVAYTSGGITTTSTTDTSGNYTLSNLPVGSYTVTAAANAYYSQSQTVVVSANTASTQNFGLAPLPGSISGRLTDRQTGSPLAGASVTYTVGGVINTATADATGNYRISNLVEGSYSLTGAAVGYSSLTQSVTLGPGGAVTSNFGLTPLPGAINGTVTDVRTGAAIAGALVAFSGGSATTTSTGAYSLTNVTEGTYTVTASATGYNTQSQTVIVGPGATVQQNFGLLAPLFKDGFESGSMSAWTTNAGLITEAALVHSGSYAAEGSVTNGATYARKTLPGTYQSVYYRTYFNLKSQSGTVSLLGVRTTSSAAIAKLFIDASNRLEFRNEVTAVNIIGPTLALNTWHSVELHVVINGTSSTTEVWLDGILVNAFQNLSANLGVVNVGMIQLGESSARTYDVVFDDVVVQTARIGQ